LNKSISIVSFIALLSLCGCGSDGSTLAPSKEQAMRDSFHAKPDINTLSPEMRKRVEAMMAASKSGPRASGTTAPPTPKQ
jgi:hypothetical protein